MTMSANAGGSSFRISFTIARRMVLQTMGRSVMIVALIAIPVIGMTAIATIQASNTATPAEQVRFELGQAQAEITVVSPPDRSLVQNPTDPGTTTFAMDSNGIPKNYTDGTPLVNPTSYLDRPLTIRPLTVTAKTAHGIAYIPAIEGQPWSKTFEGKWDLVQGTTPRNDAEIMASPGALQRLGVKIGGTVTVTVPEAKTFTVVGSLRSAALPNDGLGLYGRPGAFDGVQPAADLKGTQFYVAHQKVGLGTMKDINAQGATVYSRDLVLNPPSPGSGEFPDSSLPFNAIGYAFVGLLGGFALFEMCLLAGAAFAVGARQQQGALAVLASVGGDRKALFRVISFGGIVLGLLGSIAGILLGLTATAVFLTVSANGQADRYPGFHIDWFALLAITVLATFAAWVSAAIPARRASRLDVIQALRGANRPVATTRRRPAIGVIIVILGVIISLGGGGLVASGLVGVAGKQNLTQVQLGFGLVIVGPVIMQIGAILIAPLLLKWGAQILSRFGSGARLGSRDASRNTSRSVPALSAIMSTVFVAAFAMSLLGGVQQSSIAGYTYSQPLNSVQVSLYGLNDNSTTFVQEVGPDIANAMRTSFGVSDVYTLSSSPDIDAQWPASHAPFAVPRLHLSDACKRDASCVPAYLNSYGGDYGDKVWVGSATELSAIMGEPLTAQARNTFDAGGAVVFYPTYVAEGHVTFDWKTSTSNKIVRVATLPAIVQQPKHPYYFGIFMSPAAAASIQLANQPSAVFAQLKAPPTAAQSDSFRQALQGIGNGGLSAQVETGPAIFAQAVGWILLATTALIALGAAAIAIGLARTDGRRDDQVFRSIGAPPRLRRSFSFWQAILLAGTGSIIGVGFALIPALALSIPDHAGQVVAFPFAPPWIQLALTAIAVPLFIAAGSWATTQDAHARRPAT